MYTVTVIAFSRHAELDPASTSGRLCNIDWDHLPASGPGQRRKLVPVPVLPEKQRLKAASVPRNGPCYPAPTSRKKRVCHITSDGCSRGPLSW
jgi:hypothetical protein